ncbi:hypothetical protein [Halovenus salina]|uniref:Uncharacterized protein n=1 Tax=Halovenus salina TaxID=1510225 RepID=A0ABD5W608_9EURY
MTGTRWLYESDLPRRLLLGLAVVGVAVAAGAFIADAGDAKPDPVPFEQATTFSMPNEDRLALEERGLSVPRVEVFYSQYNYVVGYEGWHAQSTPSNNPNTTSSSANRSRFMSPITPGQTRA